MMEETKYLLEHVRKTNPEMSEERLEEELLKCKYSAIALLMVWQNEKPARQHGL